MKKIGKNTLPIFLLTFAGWLFCLLPTVAAQDFSLEASLSENQVFVGEQFSLKIEVRGSSMRNIGLPEIPEIEGVRVLSATPSRGQSISIINGRTTTVTSYTYTLIARDEGTFGIPPVSITIDGDEFTTEPMDVEVLRHGSREGESVERRPDIFAKIELDDERPTVGQQMIASLVIYFKEGVEVTSYQPRPGWRTDGFWKEELENTEQPRAETVILGGARYRKATLLRYALFPSRPGELVLTPFELNVGIRTRPNRNDPFGSVFGGLGTNQRRVTLESEEITLAVQRIESPQTGENIGAVGQFEIERIASVTQAYTGESIVVTTTISGEGNLQLISKPEYTFPDNIEVYSPQEETVINRRGTTISGIRTFTDRIVPRTAGTFTLPEKRLATFNPRTGGYNYHTLPEITFEILRDPTTTVADANSEVNLQVMTGVAFWKKDANGGRVGGNWLWLGVLVPAVALLVAWRKRELLERLQSDDDFARAHYAWDKVEELLLKAEQQAGSESPKTAYNLLHKALTGYITDRTGLPGAGLSDREICDEAAHRIENPILTGKLKQTLDKCSNISFAPVENQEDIEKDIHQTRELLKELRTLL